MIVPMSNTRISQTTTSSLQILAVLLVLAGATGLDSNPRNLLERLNAQPVALLGGFQCLGKVALFSGPLYGLGFHQSHTVRPDLINPF
jgi:hypothetical protein